MEKKKIFLLCGVLSLSVMLLVPSAFAIGTPTIISPKVPYGRVCYTYHTSRTPTFSWTPVAGATWYEIWVAETATPNTAVIDQWVEAGTSWTSGGGGGDTLTPGTDYSWWVRAWNTTEGYGAWSAGGNFTAGQFHSMIINASAFRPYNEGYTWMLNGAVLVPGDTSSHSWYAPVTLPKGAVISSLILYYYNAVGVSTASEASLRCSEYDSTSSQTLATATATTDHGYKSAYDFTIEYATVSSSYSYYIMLNLPSEYNYLIHVKINYWY